MEQVYTNFEEMQVNQSTTGIISKERDSVMKRENITKELTNDDAIHSSVISKDKENNSVSNGSQINIKRKGRFHVIEKVSEDKTTRPSVANPLNSSNHQPAVAPPQISPSATTLSTKSINVSETSSSKALSGSVEQTQHNKDEENVSTSKPSSPKQNTHNQAKQPQQTTPKTINQKKKGRFVLISTENNSGKIQNNNKKLVPPVPPLTTSNNVKSSSPASQNESLHTTPPPDNSNESDKTNFTVFARLEEPLARAKSHPVLPVVPKSQNTKSLSSSSSTPVNPEGAIVCNVQETPSFMTRVPYTAEGTGSIGLGKVFHLCDMMKSEVVEADKSIKNLKNDLKFLKEKNKELEARSKQFELKYLEEKRLREVAETKIKNLRKKNKELKANVLNTQNVNLVENEISCDGPPPAYDTVATGDLPTHVLESSAQPNPSESVHGTTAQQQVEPPSSGMSHDNTVFLNSSSTEQNITTSKSMPNIVCVENSLDDTIYNGQIFNSMNIPLHFNSMSSIGLQTLHDQQVIDVASVNHTSQSLSQEIHDESRNFSNTKRTPSIVQFDPLCLDNPSISDGGSNGNLPRARSTSSSLGVSDTMKSKPSLLDTAQTSSSRSFQYNGAQDVIIDDVSAISATSAAHNGDGSCMPLLSAYHNTNGNIVTTQTPIVMNTGSALQHPMHHVVSIPCPAVVVHQTTNHISSLHHPQQPILSCPALTAVHSGQPENCFHENVLQQQATQTIVQTSLHVAPSLNYQQKEHTHCSNENK